MDDGHLLAVNNLSCKPICTGWNETSFVCSAVIRTIFPADIVECLIISTVKKKKKEKVINMFFLFIFLGQGLLSLLFEATSICLSWLGLRLRKKESVALVLLSLLGWYLQLFSEILSKKHSWSRPPTVGPHSSTYLYSNRIRNFFPSAINYCPIWVTGKPSLPARLTQWLYEGEKKKGIWGPYTDVASWF